MLKHIPRPDCIVPDSITEWYEDDLSYLVAIQVWSPLLLIKDYENILRDLLENVNTASHNLGE